MRCWPWNGLGARRPEPIHLLTVLLIVAVPMVLLGVVRYRLQLPLGDEPHYLVISQALQLYGSLDVQRVYEARDFWSYYPQPLDPHVSPGPYGPLPLHSVGGPVLWLIPFALAGRAGVMVFMTVVSLLIVTEVFRLVRALDVDRRVAAGVAVAFGIGTPVLTYALMSFVEPLGAWGCVLALRVLQQRALRSRDLLLCSAVLGMMPWIHSRFLLFPPLFAALLAVRLLRQRGPHLREQLACLLGPIVVGLVGLVVFDAVVWHSASLVPNQVNVGAVPFTTAPGPALVGILFDQEVGVLPNFPLFLLVLPGLLVAGRHAVSAHVAVVVLPYLVVITSFPAWDGAWSPPARFLAVVLPMFAGHVALAVQAARSAVVAFVAAGLAAVGGALTTAAAFSPTGGFSARSGRSSALAQVDVVFGLDLSPFVPSLALPGQQPLLLAWLVLAGGFALVVKIDRSVRISGTRGDDVGGVLRPSRVPADATQPVAVEAVVPGS